MQNVRFVGLDVHADSIAIAVAEPGRGEPPDESTEAMRDLERAREDAKRAERAARHQLGKFLLRHGRRSPVKTAWSRKHLEWKRKEPAPRGTGSVA